MKEKINVRMFCNFSETDGQNSTPGPIVVTFAPQPDDIGGGGDDNAKAPSNGDGPAKE